MTEVVAALIWQNGRFLICQRPAHKTRGLMWEFVGGKVEVGESREEALERECREELGVKITVGDFFMDVVHPYPDLTVHLSIYHASIERGSVTLLEHNDARWITANEIDNFTFCPADRDVLIALKQLFSS